MWWTLEVEAATLRWEVGERAAWRWTEAGEIRGHTLRLDETWRETVVSADEDGATVTLVLDTLAVTLLDGESGGWTSADARGIL